MMSSQRRALSMGSRRCNFSGVTISKYVWRLHRVRDVIGWDEEDAGLNFCQQQYFSRVHDTAEGGQSPRQ